MLLITQPRCVTDFSGEMWGGGPLPKEVGDSLSREGVSIFPQYGW